MKVLEKKTEINMHSTEMTTRTNKNAISRVMT